MAPFYTKPGPISGASLGPKTESSCTVYIPFDPFPATQNSLARWQTLACIYIGNNYRSGGELVGSCREESTIPTNYSQRSQARVSPDSLNLMLQVMFQ